MFALLYFISFHFFVFCFNPNLLLILINYVYDEVKSLKIESEHYLNVCQLLTLFFSPRRFLCFFISSFSTTDKFTKR